MDKRPMIRPQSESDILPNKRMGWTGIALVTFAHVICCGGLILLSVVGTAGIASLFSFFLDPLVQWIGLAVLAGGLVILWRRLHGKSLLQRAGSVRELNPGAPDAERRTI
jgi:membrane protein implicated in regulation of membrane protease activity